MSSSNEYYTAIEKLVDLGYHYDELNEVWIKDEETVRELLKALLTKVEAIERRL